MRPTKVSQKPYAGKLLVRLDEEIVAEVSPLYSTVLVFIHRFSQMNQICENLRIKLVDKT
jgi:hypothetical protein